MKNALTLILLCILPICTSQGQSVVDAAADGNVEKVRALIAAGADVNATKNYYGPKGQLLSSGQTALTQVVAVSDNMEILRMLITAGADVNQREGNFNETALMKAAAYGDMRMVRTLLQAGAKVRLRNKFGHTASMLAAENGGAEIVWLLRTYAEDE